MNNPSKIITISECGMRENNMQNMKGKWANEQIEKKNHAMKEKKLKKMWATSYESNTNICGQW